MKIDLYSKDGVKKGQMEVSDEIFGQEVNETLIHKLLKLQLSNRRHAVAHTKTKAEVRGGGKKPYAQKHTGRARQGSIRNPHYIGGGIVFGPHNDRNFTLHMPKKERRSALLSCLSAKAKEKLIFAIEEFTPETPKTKLFAALLKKLPIEKDVLIVLSERNESLYRASRNIPTLKTILVNYLNPGDLLRYHNILFLDSAIKKLESNYSKA